MAKGSQTLATHATSVLLLKVGNVSDLRTAPEAQPFRARVSHNAIRIPLTCPHSNHLRKES